MKRIVLTATAALTLLLGGCATTIRSDVTTFHQWPAQLPDKTYAFEAPPAQDDTLELRSYQNLVRAQLAKLGFQEASGAPALQVAIKSAGDNRRLFDVTVHNQSDEMSTPAVMPALVQSAFEGFPGPNGGARRIELKQNG